MRTASGECEIDAEIADICCPCCRAPLTEAQIRSISASLLDSNRFGFVRRNRFASMTAEARTAEARKAANTRWPKRGS
jgi:hypothetical protein